MKFSYSRVVNVLKRALKVQTLPEFLAEQNELNESEFKSSLTVAHMIEDYDYLAIMNGKSEKWNKYAIAYKEGVAQYPIVLEVGKPISIEGLAKMSFDLRELISMVYFYEVIDQEAGLKELLPLSIKYQFDVRISELISEDGQLANVKNEDLCPCGSERYFQNCHGTVEVKRGRWQ